MLAILLASEEHHAPNGYHLASDINEVIWGSIAFLIVLGALIKLAGPAGAKAWRARIQRIETELAEAKTARADAEAALATSSDELPDVGAEEERIRAEASDTAARLKADLIAKAEAEADGLLARGRADVESYRRQAIADLAQEVSRLTQESTEAVVVGLLDEDAHSDLIESYITQVEQLT